jgi:hypothetical protein
MSTHLLVSTANLPRGAKTLAQTRAIFGLAKGRGLSDDELRGVVEEVTGQRSISALTRHQAENVIIRLGGTINTPRRTIQFRRQQSGVKQIASPAHLELMRSLATRRGMNEETLAALSNRIVKHYPPRTTSDTNKVIEALKAMSRREQQR